MPERQRTTANEKSKATQQLMKRKAGTKNTLLVKDSIFLS
jgi:hypothetical protein